MIWYWIQHSFQWKGHGWLPQPLAPGDPSNLRKVDQEKEEEADSPTFLSPYCSSPHTHGFWPCDHRNHWLSQGWKELLPGRECGKESISTSTFCWYFTRLNFLEPCRYAALVFLLYCFLYCHHNALDRSLDFSKVLNHTDWAYNNWAPHSIYTCKFCVWGIGISGPKSLIGISQRTGGYNPHVHTRCSHTWPMSNQREEITSMTHKYHQDTQKRMAGFRGQWPDNSDVVNILC